MIQAVLTPQDIVNVAQLEPLITWQVTSSTLVGQETLIAGQAQQTVATNEVTDLNSIQDEDEDEDPLLIRVDSSTRASMDTRTNQT